MPRARPIPGFDYATGRAVTLDLAEWRERAAKAKGRAQRDPDGALAVYDTKGVRQFEIYDDERRVRL